MADPAPAPDNNTANLLNDTGLSVGEEVNQFGSFIGALADWAGAIGAISSLIGLFVTTEDPNQTIIDALQQAYAQLAAADKAQRIIDRWNSTTTDLAPADSVLQSLNVTLKGLPLSPFEITQTLDPCLTPLNDLGYDIYGRLPAWTALYSDQIYWNDVGLYTLGNFWPSSGPLTHSGDVGYGTIAPPQPSDNIIFNYRFVLPTYLRAVCIFLIVGKAIDPTFVTDYAAPLRTTAQLLSDVHDKIANVQQTQSEGIVVLSPLQAWLAHGGAYGLWRHLLVESGLLQPSGNITYLSAGALVPPVVQGATIWGWGNPLGQIAWLPEPDELLTNPASMVFEYGAVETFSGYSSIGNYVVPVKAYANGQEMLGKFVIRRQKRLMDVYVGVGLFQVWTAINKLKALVGDVPKPQHRWSFWSFRLIITETGLPADPTTNTFSLFSLAKYFKYTPPIDTSQDSGSPTSFRELLNH